MRQHDSRFALPREQTAGSLLERRVRVTFLDTPSALHARPEPRAVFDNTAREHNYATPWRALGLPLRCVARAAKAMGGPAVDVTRQKIVAAVLAFLAWVLEPMDDGTPLEAVVYLQLVREEAEALEAQSVARALGTEDATARAIRETEEAIQAERCYLGTLANRFPTFPRSMGATPTMELVR